MIASLDGLASSRYLFAIVSDTAQRRAAVVVQALSFSVSSVPPEVSDAVSEQLKNFPKMSVIKAEIYKQMGIPPLSASDSSSDDYDFDKFARELPKLEGDGTSSQIVEQLDRFQQKIAPRYAELFAQMTRLNEHMERRRAFFQRMQTEYFNQQRAEMQETLKAAPQRLAAIRARVAALAAHRSSERAETLRRELIPLASTWLLLPTDDQMAETSQLSADVTRLRADFEHFNRRRDEKAAQQTAAARVRPAIDLSGDASQFAAASAASSLPTPSQSQRLTAQDEARLTRMVTKLDRSMSDLKAQFDLLLVRPSSDVLMLECSPLSAERSVHSSRHSVPSDESDDESSKRGEAAHADFRLSVAVAGGSENVPAPSISVEHIVRSLLPASAPAIESTHALLPAHAVAPASAAVAVSHAPALVFSPQTVRSVRTPVQLLAAAEILSARAEKPAQEPLQVHAALLVASPNPAAVASAASPAPHSRLSLQPLFSPLAHFPGQHRAAAVASAFANSGSDPATPVRPAKAAASALTPNVVTPSATKSVVKEGLLSGRKVLRNPLAFLNQTRDGVATASRLSAVSADEQGAGALVSPLATSHAAATSGKAAGESSAVEEASIRGATPVFPTPTSSRGPMTPLPIPLLTKPAVAPHSAFFFSPARSAQKAGK